MDEGGVPEERAGRCLSAAGPDGTDQAASFVAHDVRRRGRSAPPILKNRLHGSTERYRTQVLLGCVGFLLLLVSNRGVWLCLRNLEDPLSFCRYDNLGLEFALNILACALALLLLGVTGGFEIVLGKLRRMPQLLAFVLLALFSSAWSVQQAGTILQIQPMIAVTFLALVLGTVLTARGFLNLLTAFSAVVVVSSWALLVAFPSAAIMGKPHEGCWRGIFWHKNLAGPVLALAGTVFLLRLITAAKRKPLLATLAASGWILASIFTFFSRSAAGVVTAVVLNGIALGLPAWRTLRPRLSRRALLGGSLAAVAGAALLSWKVEVLFSLVGRSADLTGRIPLWEWLGHVGMQRLWFGHGFGAIWLFPGFREAVTQSQRWSFTIANGHNGFVDVFLGLGAVGVVAAFSVVLTALVRGYRYWAVDGSAASSLPVLLVVYFLLANASVSLFLDVESFHWMLLVAALAVTTLPRTRGT